jgi:hypothetical protein
MDNKNNAFQVFVAHLRLTNVYFIEQVKVLEGWKYSGRACKLEALDLISVTHTHTHKGN